MEIYENLKQENRRIRKKEHGKKRNRIVEAKRRRDVWGLKVWESLLRFAGMMAWSFVSLRVWKSVKKEVWEFKIWEFEGAKGGDAGLRAWGF